LLGFYVIDSYVFETEMCAVDRFAVTENHLDRSQAINGKQVFTEQYQLNVY